MTSIDYIFAMEKALVKIIFSHKMFTCQPIFKNFVALFRTFGMQKDDCAGGVSEQGDMQKRQFPKDGVKRVACHIHPHIQKCIK